MADGVFAAVAVLQLGDALVNVAAGLAGAVRAGDEALRQRQLELDLEQEALVGAPVLGERALVDEEQREGPGAAVEALSCRVAELADQDDAGGALDGDAGLQAGGVERDRDGDRAARVADPDAELALALAVARGVGLDLGVEVVGPAHVGGQRAEVARGEQDRQAERGREDLTLLRQRVGRVAVLLLVAVVAGRELVVLGRILHVAPQLAIYYYSLNLSGAPFKGSAALRTALSMVIDREKLVRAVTGLGEMPAYTLVPPGIPGYSPPRSAYADWPMARRIERARELLHEGGGVPGSIELRYNTGDLHARLAVAVASMWKQALGIDTVLRAEEFKVLLQDIQRREGLQAFRASWVADYDDPYSFLQLLRSGFGINLPGYSNAAYDSLLDEASRATNPTLRASLLQRAEGQMLEDQPLIPLYFYVSKRLVKPRVQGFSDNPLNIVYSKDLSLR